MNNWGKFQKQNKMKNCSISQKKDGMEMEKKGIKTYALFSSKS